MIFGVLAGESSGDNLGANLIKAMKQRDPNARFVGIGGPLMIKEGLDSWVDMDRLSVNGLVDPIKRLPDLIRILLQTRNRMLEAKPVCFIGIDSNFFNLILEGMLKKRGVKTVHYVSPTVWAWRKGRIKSIARKVDLMLTLYPFELGIYRENNINAVFVGHPKADEINFDEGSRGKLTARDHYGIRRDVSVVAILPGSRASEVAYTSPDFFGAAQKIVQQIPNVAFVIPAANEKRRLQIESLLDQLEDQLPVTLTVGDAKTAMQAADVVLVNSGTATLEAMLLKKPMVMSYRLGAVSYAIISRMVRTEFFALPNILSQQELVPELIQHEATPEALSSEVLKLLSAEDNALVDKFDEIHRDLRKNSGQVAANAIFDLIEHVSA